MKECGVNTTFLSLSLSVLSESLTNREINDFYYLGNSALTEKGSCEAVVGNFKGRKGLAGWVLASPISYQQMLAESTETRYSVLDAFKKINDLETAANITTHPIFISLDGSPQDTDVVGNDFKSYIEQFQLKFQPGFWPFMLMPLRINSTDNDYNNFYGDLEIFSFIGRYTDTPIWAYCSCEGDGVDMPVPTEAGIRYCVFTALAYGAQGICYTPYRKTSGSRYSGAPIDDNDNKTQTWYYIQTVNQEVKAFNDIFCGCQLLDCRYFVTGLRDQVINKKDENIPESAKKLIYRYTKIWYDSMGPVQSIEAPAPGIIISHLFNAGKDYLVIVNRSPEASMTISLNFNSYWKVYRIQKSGASYIKTEIKNYDSALSYQLAAGGYLIFSWE